MRTTKIVDVDEWDSVVIDTYKRPYSFQQQDNCRSRGIFYFTIPNDADDFKNESIPEEINHAEMGVSFSAWLARNPATPIANDTQHDWCTVMWWERNFYPDVQMVANDLYAKGLLDAGDYAINIDW